LQRSNVVSSVEWRTEIEGAIAQVVTGLYELAPAVGTDPAVDAQAASLLERAHGVSSRGSERSVELARIDVSTERDQTLLDVMDLGAAIAEAEDTHATQCPPRRPTRQPGQ
jgi:hypothetical protein